MDYLEEVWKEILLLNLLRCQFSIMYFHCAVVVVVMMVVSWGAVNS